MAPRSKETHILPYGWELNYFEQAIHSYENLELPTDSTSATKLLRMDWNVIAPERPEKIGSIIWAFWSPIIQGVNKAIKRWDELTIQAQEQYNRLLHFQLASVRLLGEIGGESELVLLRQIATLSEETRELQFLYQVTVDFYGGYRNELGTKPIKIYTYPGAHGPLADVLAFSENLPELDNSHPYESAEFQMRRLVEYITPFTPIPYNEHVHRILDNAILSLQDRLEQ